MSVDFIISENVRDLTASEKIVTVSETSCIAFALQELCLRSIVLNNLVYNINGEIDHKICITVNGKRVLDTAGLSRNFIDGDRVVISIDDSIQ